MHVGFFRHDLSPTLNPIRGCLFLPYPLYIHICACLLYIASIFPSLPLLSSKYSPTPSPSITLPTPLTTFYSRSLSLSTNSSTMLPLLLVRWPNSAALTLSTSKTSKSSSSVIGTSVFRDTLPTRSAPSASSTQPRGTTRRWRLWLHKNSSIRRPGRGAINICVGLGDRHSTISIRLWRGIHNSLLRIHTAFFLNSCGWRKDRFQFLLILPRIYPKENGLIHWFSLSPPRDIPPSFFSYRVCFLLFLPII